MGNQDWQVRTAKLLLSLNLLTYCAAMNIVVSVAMQNVSDNSRNKAMSGCLGFMAYQPL